MTNQNNLAGVFTSVPTDALLSILHIPDKETETREKIAEKSSETLDNLKNEMEFLLNNMKGSFKDKE